MKLPNNFKMVFILSSVNLVKFRSKLKYKREKLCDVDKFWNICGCSGFWTLKEKKNTFYRSGESHKHKTRPSPSD